MIWIIVGFFGLVSFLVSQRLKSKFKKYAQTHLSSDMSGAEAAAKMLHDHRIHDVEVFCVAGQLTDHYNPAKKTVNLSEDVYHGRNAAAVAVASHEVGHAVQHATAYNMLEFRSMMVPVQSISGKILNVIFFMSMFGAFLFTAIPLNIVLLVIIACYGVATLFSFITLPVEFDASRRALSWMKAKQVVTSEEYAMSKDALKWAALTYVVAALSSLVMLLYYLASFLGRRD